MQYFDQILHANACQHYLTTDIVAVCVNAPASVNVDNNGRYRSRYCKRVYNNDTVSINVDSNGGDISRYCQRLHCWERVTINYVRYQRFSQILFPYPL